MEFTIKSSKREEFIDITEKIQESLPEKDGIVQVFIPHATSGVTINENADENVAEDILTMLRQAVPKGKWLHDKVDGNADAHIKVSLIGNSVFIPFSKGKLELGTWQDVFLCEFDGPKSRNVILSFLSKE